MAITYAAGDNNGNWNGGTILNGRSSQNGFGFYIGVRETYVGSGSENTSNIAIQIGIKNNGSRFNSTGWCFKYTVDGAICDYQTGVNIATNYAGFYDDVRPITIDNSNNRGMYVNNIPHNDDGTKKVHIKVEMYDIDGYASSSPGYCVVEDDFTLTTIARYFSQTPALAWASGWENGATFNWSTSENCDWVRYSLDGANWVDVFGYNVAKSGSFTVSNLAANTSHNIYINCRRQDSQLWSNSGNVSFSTYDYPKPNSVSNFTIGNAATVNVYNPLGRTYTLDLISNNNGAVIGTYSGAINGNVSGFNSSSSINTQYASIPNSASGTYYARVTYGSSVKTKGTGTYSIKGTEKPVVTTTAVDNGKTLSDSITPSATTTDLTGDNKKIIKFISNVDVSVSATGQNSATISSYSTKYGSNAAISGQPHTYENVESTTFTGTATDSRNLSNSANATGLTLINYVKLTLDNIELYRDVQTSNTLKCRGEGNYFSGSFGSQNNSLTFRMRYKEKSSSTWSSWSTKTMTIGTNKYTFDFQVGTDFNYTKTYDFQFKVTDKCMNTGTISAIAKPGIPIQGLFESFVENFGIKSFINDNGELAINGDIKISGSNKYLKNL